MNEINGTMDTLMELYFHTQSPEALHYKYLSSEALSCGTLVVAQPVK